MKVLFAGPTIHGLDIDLGDLVVRPPAQKGDVLAAVRDGATAIGIIDGTFEANASVWHKEILYALSSGVTVMGAASMGALRAAECAAFGMVAVGRLANAYLSGELDDDAAVAQLHGPAEFGSPPLSETLVDAEATLARLFELGRISAEERATLVRAARAIFFKDRTVEAMAEVLGPRARQLAADYRQHRISLKAAEAQELIAALVKLPNRRRLQPSGWTLSEPEFWKRALLEAA